MDKKDVEHWCGIYRSLALEIKIHEHSVGIRFGLGWIVVFDDRFIVIFDKKNFGNEIVADDPFPLVFELLVRSVKSPRSVKKFIQKHAR